MEEVALTATCAFAWRFNEPKTRTDNWYAIMTKQLEPIIGPKLKAHMMGMAEENSNRLQHLAGIKRIT